VTAQRVLFIGREGTLIEEPPHPQVDGLAKMKLLRGVIPALLELQRAGYRLVLVGNRDGSATPVFPGPNIRECQDFMRDLFTSQGITFETSWAAAPLDRDRSYLIADRDTDLQLAGSLGVRGIRVRAQGTEEESWPAIAKCLARVDRIAQVSRRTKETDIVVRVNLDQPAPVAISTGIGFFDHMLEQVARHGGFSLELTCKGDLQVDEHHTIEDCALALGQALREALGDKRGIARYGFLLPMDESQARVAIDLSGRAYAVFEGRFGRESVGGMPTELVPHFFRSLADSLGAAVHVSVTGENSHHMVEACFKGVGRALRQAIHLEGTELPSTKGVL
jgi:imidazoleglycerol-phosphate dehydratase/histidinol-phosphatase